MFINNVRYNLGFISAYLPTQLTTCTHLPTRSPTRLKQKNFSFYSADKFWEKWIRRDFQNHRSPSMQKTKRTGNLRITCYLGRVRVTTVSVLKQEVSHIIILDLVTLMQISSFLPRIISPSVTCLALPYFSTLSNKWHDFRKKLLKMKCVFWFSLQALSETFLFLRII